MIATLVNCVAVIIGSLLGLILHTKINESFKRVVYVGAGMISLILGIKMGLVTTRIVFMALALIIGGMLGEWWNVEGGILRFGDFLKKRLAKKESGKDFAGGFLNASVLFCVGAMTLVGAFKAGAEGNYDLILTKSVMDGFMAIMLTAAMGIGVAFSAITILVYQGGITLLAGVLQPLVNELLLGELTAVGGVLVIMIGLNLLGLSKLKTANYIPALLITIGLITLEPLLPFTLG
ncbi:putative membrane protein YdfK [subsurface metagenome]